MSGVAFIRGSTVDKSLNHTRIHLRDTFVYALVLGCMNSS